MLYGLYLSTAGMQAEDYRQSVFANNLANSQTNGFKRDLATILSRAAPVDEDPQMAGYRGTVLSQQGGGVFPAPSRMDLSQGTLEASSNKLDVALKGEGFFMVQGNNGQTELTRDGRFLINNNSELVMQSGEKVLDETGNPIKLNSGSPVQIMPNGEIQQDGNAVAQLALRNVSDPGGLQKRGNNLLTITGKTELTAAPADTEVKQGYTEASSVNPIIEMVNMMEGQRAFEANAHMITYQDQTLQEINMVGRLA